MIDHSAVPCEATVRVHDVTMVTVGNYDALLNLSAGLRQITELFPLKNNAVLSIMKPEKL